MSFFVVADVPKTESTSCHNVCLFTWSSNLKISVSSAPPPVPIIPSYLYNLDESTDVTLQNNTVPQQNPPGAFHSIVSLYDNTVKSPGSNATAGPPDPPPVTPAAAQLPQNSSDCPESSSKLLNENVKVGMLFASKATVQLITNPFIGPLTNR